MWCSCSKGISPSRIVISSNNGKKCLLISMEMQQGNNIVQYGNDVNKVLEEFQTELPQGS